MIMHLQVYRYVTRSGSVNTSLINSTDSYQAVLLYNYVLLLAEITGFYILLAMYLPYHAEVDL